VLQTRDFKTGNRGATSTLQFFQRLILGFIHGHFQVWPHAESIKLKHSFPKPAGQPLFLSVNALKATSKTMRMAKLASENARR
jgi:hypothetical protein